MPALDGWGAIRELQSRADTATIPVIILTGHDFKAYLKHSALAVGAVSYLMKPFFPEEFQREVNARLTARRNRAAGAVWSAARARLDLRAWTPRSSTRCARSATAFAAPPWHSRFPRCAKARHGPRPSPSPITPRSSRSRGVVRHRTEPMVSGAPDHRATLAAALGLLGFEELAVRHGARTLVEGRGMSNASRELYPSQGRASNIRRK